MPLSDDSSEISPSLAELTTQLIPAATTVTITQSTPTAPTAVAASDRTDRPVFRVTILGPTNSSKQAPPNRHNDDDDDDVHTTRQHDNVTLRSSDANRHQTRHNGDPDRDDDDGDTNPRRRIDSPPQRYLRRQGLDRASTVTTTQFVGITPSTEIQRATIRPLRINRVVAKTVVTLIVKITVNATILTNANTMTIIETTTIIDVLMMTIKVTTILVVTTMTPTLPGTTVIRALHTVRSTVTTIVTITKDVNITMIAATTINVRAIIVATYCS